MNITPVARPHSFQIFENCPNQFLVYNVYEFLQITYTKLWNQKKIQKH